MVVALDLSRKIVFVPENKTVSELTQIFKDLEEAGLSKFKIDQKDLYVVKQIGSFDFDLYGPNMVRNLVDIQAVQTYKEIYLRNSPRVQAGKKIYVGGCGPVDSSLREEINFEVRVQDKV